MKKSQRLWLILSINKNRLFLVMVCFDTGVTTDKHKIFRFPGTIHPSYGFVATSLELSDLDDPSIVFDKIKKAGGVDLVEVTLDHDAIEDFEVRKHWAAGTYTIPRWLALHLLHQ